MFKKTITYTDFNGVERTEDFYFNLMKSELAKLELTKDQSMSSFLQRIVNAKDVPQIVEVFDQIILMSYGEKSDDGRYFIKNDEIRERFKCSPAYDAFYMSFISRDDELSAKAMSDFINGIMPKEVSDQIDNQLAKKA